MGRRYKRREFLTDAVVAATGCVLLKVFAPDSTAAVSSPDSAASSVVSAPASEQVR